MFLDVEDVIGQCHVFNRLLWCTHASAHSLSYPHLYDLALLIADPHDDLYIFLRCLVVLVKVASLYREVDVIANISWHNNLWEAQFAGHHSAAVHQVGIFFSNLTYVPNHSLHGHPQTWREAGGERIMFKCLALDVPFLLNITQYHEKIYLLDNPLKRRLGHDRIY